jgi:UDP-glucose 4-epimerase
MKILVTGGAGFIASHIAEAYLAAGNEVVIIDNLSTGNRKNIPTKAKFIEMDITSPKINEIFAAEKFDIVNHHAAQMNVRFSVEDPIFDAKTNILGGLNLYEAARKNGVKKIILASTGGAIYGDQELIPTPENVFLEPCSPYGIAKLANEKYLAFYKETYGLDFVCLRYANIYGPRQNAKGEAGVVAIFITKMLNYNNLQNNEQPIINGDGFYTRDYVFVEDVVKANLIALKSEVSGIFNVGTEIETTTNEIFQNIKKLTNSNVAEIHGEAKKGEQRKSCISYKKFLETHNWKPETKLIDGLSKTIEYFKNMR